MTLSSFEDLLHAARHQPERQRLLFVFAAAGVDEDATPAQRAHFERGQGGTLTPLMTVDKAPEDLASFAALAIDSMQPGGGGGGGGSAAWSVVFVAALPGTAAAAPGAAQSDAALQRMVASIKAGQIGGYIAFDTQGLPVQFS